MDRVFNQEGAQSFKEKWMSSIKVFTVLNTGSEVRSGRLAGSVLEDKMNEWLKSRRIDILGINQQVYEGEDKTISPNVVLTLLYEDNPLASKTKTRVFTLLNNSLVAVEVKDQSMGDVLDKVVNKWLNESHVDVLCTRTSLYGLGYSVKPSILFTILYTQ